MESEVSERTKTRVGPDLLCRVCGVVKPSSEYRVGYRHCLACMGAKLNAGRRGRRTGPPLECKTCRVVKPAEEFNAAQLKCRPCSQAWNSEWHRNQPPHKRRTRSLRANYGMTDADVQTMLLAQNHECALCHKGPLVHGPRSFGGVAAHIDHDHDTGAVRAILCAACNLLLGRFGDDPRKLDEAAAYLRSHGAKGSVTLAGAWSPAALKAFASEIGPDLAASG